jgi:mono/diheme cytochrome c family protein
MTKHKFIQFFVGVALVCSAQVDAQESPYVDGSDLPETLTTLFDNHCVDCHGGAEAEGGLNLQSLEWDLEDPHVTGIWVKIHDRLASGEMPPKEESRLDEVARGAAVKDLASRIVRLQEKRYTQQGRAVSRRVNRFEYENILRDLLHDPHLKIADQLPLDGEVHGFAKVGDALDVSHVQVDAYLDAANFSLRRAIEFPATKPGSTKRRYYAREQGRMWAGTGNSGWARFSLALEGLNINEKYSFSKRGFDPVKQPQPVGITVDDTKAEQTGPWRKSTRRSNHVGAHYLADDNKNTGAFAITWKATLPKPGTYEVRVSFGGGEGLARKAPYRVRHAKGETRLAVDQSQELTIQGLWYPLGRFTFGSSGADPKTEPVVAEVSLSNKDARGWVIADAVQFVHIDDLKKENQKPRPPEDASTAIFRGAYTPFYYGFEKFKAPVRGDYKLRLKARSVLRQTDYVDWEGEKKPRHYPNLVLDATRRYPTPVNDRIFTGKRSEPVKVYSSTLYEPNTQSMLPIGMFEAPPETPEVSELEAFLEKGAMVKLDCMRLPSPMVPAMPHTIQKTDGGYPGVAFHWLEVEGPIVEEWPPASYRALFGDVPFKQAGRHVEAVSEQPSNDAGTLLAAFMERVYRRPVAEAEFDRFHLYAKQLLKDDNSFTEAMIATYSAVLASPEFLFHCGQPGQLDDFALAERLSFFLGESMPDEHLRAVARQGKLRESKTLRAEVNRLLDKSEAKRFVKEFLNSWLKLDEINDTDPDRELYPEYAGDWWLVNSMVEESRLYFADLIDSNRPARNVIDADYTFVDERLARHYGVPGVFGPSFRRKSLPEKSPYGGILTQAAVLKVTANGTVTSPVLRGVYVMERLLGDPPSPPPPSVPAVEPDIRGAATIRELLKKHRADASCASCHKKIDPPGFALESFDVMGRWRENYRSLAQGSKRIEGVGRSGNEFVHYIGKEVDASGVTPEGGHFDDILQFKKLLLQDEEAIARNLIEQLLVYATGAPVGFADRDDVSAILEKSRVSAFGVRTVIHEIIQSPLFLRK